SAANTATCWNQEAWLPPAPWHSTRGTWPSPIASKYSASPSWSTKPVRRTGSSVVCVAVTRASSHRQRVRCGVASTSLASGLRVVEIGESIAAATAGWVLSDYGADVFVVEPPGGSRLRRAPAWPMWARGKRTAPLDLTTDDGRAALGGLVDGADVVIVALEPATADRLGVDAASL